MVRSQDLPDNGHGQDIAVAKCHSCRQCNHQKAAMPISCLGRELPIFWQIPNYWRGKRKKSVNEENSNGGALYMLPECRDPQRVRSTADRRQTEPKILQVSNSIWTPLIEQFWPRGCIATLLDFCQAHGQNVQGYTYLLVAGPVAAISTHQRDVTNCRQEYANR